MSNLRSLVARLRELARRSRLERERVEEFRFHVDMQIEHNVARGMSPDEARRAALVAFGGEERFGERTREARGFAVLDHVLRDTRFALRRLRRSPGFSCGVIATLAVGIAAAVSIGTLVYGVLLRPLPFTRPHELVQIAFRTPGLDGGREHAHSEATYAHFHDAARSFTALGAYYINDVVNFTDGDDPQRVTAVMITPGTFAALQVAPMLGRLFVATDALETGTINVLISHELWQNRYGADVSILDRVIEINRRARRVVGVLPEGFDFPTPSAAVWFPVDITADRPALNSRYLNVIARLRVNVDAQDAEAELNALIPQLPHRFPVITAHDVARSGAHAEVQTLREAMVAPIRQHLLMLALTMVFVLLIATANVTNLFLLRSERQRHEIAITRALGGGTSALVRRFLIEGIVAGVVAGTIALPIVLLAVNARFGFSQREIPRLHEIVFGTHTLATLLVMAIALGALVGLLAFARTRVTSLALDLRRTRNIARGGWQRLQQTLVVTQVAMALALVLSSALMARSLWNLRAVDLGFTPERRSSFEVTLPLRGYSNYEETAVFHAGVLDRLRALPGVTGAEAALEIPLAPEQPGALSLPFDGVGTQREEMAAANVATPGYFDVMGIPLLHGRTFAAGDVASVTPGIVLSASLARALFGDVNAVGRLVRPPSPGVDVFHRVVGVVGDVPRWRIEDGPARMAYFPLLRDNDGVASDPVRTPILISSARYVLRSDVSTTQLAPSLRLAVRELDARVPVTNITSLPAIVDAATARVRLTMLLLAVAAGAALLLGVIGLYSIVSYTVSGRMREFGVRLALGATPAAIRRLVLRDGALVIALGVVAGLITALWGARFAQSLLYGVSPHELTVYVTATAAFAAVVTMAMLLPARRAGMVDPVDVMRQE
jgi:predicted permease